MMHFLNKTVTDDVMIPFSNIKFFVRQMYYAAHRFDIDDV